MAGDVRGSSSGHPVFLVIGLGMVLIALLTVGALLVMARRRGLSASERAALKRWRQRVMGAPENGAGQAFDEVFDDDGIADGYRAP